MYVGIFFGMTRHFDELKALGGDQLPIKMGSF